jgi:cytidyltransferase-like protein
MGRVFVSASFDDLRSRGMRFLQEASRLGAVHAYVRPDLAVREDSGRPPKFPQEERLYLVQSLRWVASASISDGRPTGRPGDGRPSQGTGGGDAWVVDEEGDNAGQRRIAADRGLRYHVIPAREVAGFPAGAAPRADGGMPARSAVVTGCFDWLHSGHVRFFEEVSALGRLYVVVGSDENVRLLKGDGHPMFPQEERRYMAGSIRFVADSLVSTGSGWMDAEPEIRRIRPDIYAVNEDGDKPEKRDFCRDNGIEYVVLRRIPRPGLPSRTSTDLRGS